MKSLNKSELQALDGYFRAANYLTVGELYLLANPLLKRPLKVEDIKKKLVGHWGTTPGQNFIYTHLNRLICKYNLDMIYISGPGHGGGCVLSNSYLEGTYSEIYPSITEDEAGLQKLFKRFSFPGGTSSHAEAGVPGSINEGGELGYSLSHAFGAVFDNPNLIAACVIGDGEAETGPLATSWHGNKFLNPKNDGVVLPILHLNGYKIANPTILARMSEVDLISYFKGCGWDPIIVSGSDVKIMHEKMASALDNIVKKIRKIKTGDGKNIRYPMLILRTPKGWTGPKTLEGKKIEGNFKAHQIPFEVREDNPKYLGLLENWLKSYHPEELFDETGKLKKEYRLFIPKGTKRMSASLYANGGKLLKELNMPDYKNYMLDIKKPGEVIASDMMELGNFIKDIIAFNEKSKNFRIFAPDETLSNRLNHVFEKTNKQWNSKILSNDEYLNNNGRVIDGMLSEHMCEGWLEGYLLTGRHGFINSYEAFIRIVDSMTSQHAKWLKVCNELSWRASISSLNYVLSSHVWQQDHNGYTHQDPGFLNHVVTKKPNIVRAYLPPDANCLISCFDHCIRSKNYVNVIIASKHPRQQWLSKEQAIKHCSAGIGIWAWASTDNLESPDVVLACAGDTPTLEVLAATTILKEYFKDLKIRVVNVVDLMRLVSNEEHPHGLKDEDYDMIFTKEKPIIFAFHGYPNLIHELTYKRHNQNLHVKGYNEEGTITTPFDMRVQNEIDRYHLVMNVIKYVPKLQEKAGSLMQYCQDKLVEHKEYIKEYGIDMPEITDWQWK